MMIADDVVGEFRGASLGDARRASRLRKLAYATALHPGSSLPKAVGDEAAREGAYRFLENDEVTATAITSSHIEATSTRCAGYGRVYAVSDTTEFAFSGEEPREGLGPLQGNRQGFLGHFCIAVAGDGSRRPLGLLAWKTWVRAAELKKRQSGRERSKDPHRESKKWKQVAEDAESALNGHPEVIHVMDREADAYDLLAWLRRQEMRFVVRVRHDRKLGQTEPFSSLFEGLEDAQVVFERDVPLNARPRASKEHSARTGRTARLQYAYKTLVVRRPITAESDAPQELELNFVHITEPNPPTGETPVDWKLVTTEPVTTTEAVAGIVDAYRARWTIEEYFKAIKTGCAYEKSQLESVRTLLNYLAVLLPVAWQLLLIRNFGRDEPSRPASEILTPIELQVLIAMCRDKLPPKPTIAQAMLGIARLGGHIKNNGTPGWQVLGRGYEDLCRYVEAWKVAKSSLRSDQS